MNAIAVAKKGDVIVIEKGGRMDTSCLGEILSNAAKMKGVLGIAFDGCYRDILAMLEVDYPVFTEGWYMSTGKDRIYADKINVPT